MRGQSKKYRGFTLIEILIALAIISSLSGIAVIQFKIALDRSKANKTIAEVETIGSAIAQIEEETRKGNDERIYIHQMDWLAKKVNPNPGDPDLFSPWQGPYISSLPPKDENGYFKDTWGNPYYYDYWTSESQEPPDYPLTGEYSEERWKLPPEDTMEQHYVWYHVYGGSYKGGFVLGSYGSDGEQGGEGYAQDIIYRQYYPPIVQVEKQGCGACFIATAAYGSYEEPHVQVLRKFRDRYLLANNLGKKLVRLYYRYSPSAASFIARHNTLKAMVRIGLLPIIGLAYLVINTTLLQQILLLLSLILSFIFLLIKRRGQAILTTTNSPR